MKYMSLWCLLTACEAEPVDTSSEVAYIVFTDDEGACEDTAVDGWYPDVPEESLCQTYCCSETQCVTDTTAWREDGLFVGCTQCGSNTSAEVRCISVASP